MEDETAEGKCSILKCSIIITLTFQGIWIVKPPADSCGKGIRIVTEPEDVLDSRLVVVKWHDPAHASIEMPQQNSASKVKENSPEWKID